MKGLQTQFLYKESMKERERVCFDTSVSLLDVLEEDAVAIELGRRGRKRLWKSVHLPTPKWTLGHIMGFCTQTLICVHTSQPAHLT